MSYRTIYQKVLHFLVFSFYLIGFVSVLSGFGGKICLIPQDSKQEQNSHQKPKAENYHYFKKLLVKIGDFDAQGLILDIGGGGEGVIGQLKGSQVVAIDINRRELEDAPPGPLKIVMDGRDLKFLDNTFKTATVFFTFMYITGDDHIKVFSELSRVMQPGGRLLIWDVIFPRPTNKEKFIAVFPLSITLPKKEIKTGYGVRWPDDGRDINHYLEIAEMTGFKVKKKVINDLWFYLELLKQD